jgi:hypothetical protein
MIFLWLFIWLIAGTPEVNFSLVNGWAIFLIISIVMDLSK